MGVAEEIPFLPFDEYLAAEQAPFGDHEYVSGRTYPMAGGTERHDVTYEHDLSLIVEVLSPSTADVDRREKSIVYASPLSFEQYVLVHPDQRRIEVATVGPGGLRWQVYGPGMVVFTRFGDLAVDALHDERDATALT